MKKGDVIELKVLKINIEERKIMLGMKQLKPNPWETIEERFPIGSIHTRKIKKIVKFGMFVELEDEVDRLIHVSDISWIENKKDNTKSYKVDDEVEFKILDINSKEMRITCGIKQLIKSPWEVIKEKYKTDAIVEGIVTGITQFGLFMKLEENVEGLVHISEVSSSRIENIEDHFKINDKIKAVVLGVDVEKKRLSLSIKNYESIYEKAELQKVLNNTGSGRVTLGDLVNIKLEDG